MPQGQNQRIHAKAALLPTGWRENVRVTISGRVIAAVASDVPPDEGDERHAVLVPAVANVHSHAFQRVMAGLTEVQGTGTDSFWTWRAQMYKFALAITPGDLQNIAAQVYLEMLEAGFSRVGEFHYLHHDKDGRPYANIAELAERIAAAAAESGIGLTLLPVFYAHSDFGEAAPSEGQRRFINSLDSFSQLIEGARTLTRQLPEMNVGIAPHSLRAVAPDELSSLVAMAGQGPIHIHVAEQMKEVEDCLAWSGSRPVEWLLDNAAIDERWCLVHATHMTDNEIGRLARSGAIVGLCPITEANLGDGIFPAKPFLQEKGRYGVGSDSNVQVSLSAELRQLEYSQRLLWWSRNVIASPEGSCGRRLFDLAVNGGAAALGVATGLLSGAPADLVSLDCTMVPYLSRDSQLDAWIFSDSVRIDCVWAGGRRLVSNGRHVNREAINRRFVQTMHRLLCN